MPDIAVNGVPIGNAAIAREVQNQVARSPREAWDAAGRALVVRELLLQRARSLDLRVVPQAADGARETDEEALIRTLLEQEVHTPQADAESCRRYYDANRRRFRAPDLFEPMHILFKARRDDLAAYQAATLRAATVLEELRAHPDRFADLARDLSDCPSAGEGGRLGQVAAGETTPEFEAALRRLQPGQTCETPVGTRYGVHVLRLERKAAGEVLPFAAVQARIASYLEESAWRRGVAQYVALLAGQARIENCAFPVATSPLVQ